jgi:hypothetical protein
MQAFSTSTGREYEGLHDRLDPPLQILEEKMGLVHSESMDVQNDPRFFQHTVLNKRLAAFSTLSVVSGLLVGTSAEVISMKKDMNFWTFTGQLQIVSFLIMTAVLWANVVATYVGVAQVYHSFRLETAGPTGFEMAASYYLNPNIISWRHLAIKSMLYSLPLFLISSGMRIEVHFERAAVDPTPPTWFEARCMGLFFLAVYVFMGLTVWYAHYKHVAIFKERYEVATSQGHPFLSQVHNMMASTRLKGHVKPLDV